MGYEYEGVAIVIDNGSGSCKAGFAGDDIPRSVFPSVVGHANTNHSDSYVGDESSPATTYPIKRGVVDSEKWDAMEKVWQRAFCDLLGDDPTRGGDLKECPVHLAEPPLNPMSVREKTTEIMFEKFEVPAFYLSMQAVLALYASGRTTGIVLDSGDGVTHAVPISDCYAITHAITQLDFAGGDLTNSLIKDLKFKRGLDITSAIGRDIKEKHCRVALTSEEFSAPEETYYLPDGETVTIGDLPIQTTLTLGEERFSTPEALFKQTFLRYDPHQPTFLTPDPNQPTFLTPDPNQLPTFLTPQPVDESEIVGIHGVIYESISKLKSSKSDRAKMYGNVVLSGGSTMFPGLDKRMEAELTSLLKRKDMAGTKVNISPSTKYSTWLGGSILASLSTFDSLWCTKEEYEEKGKYYENKGYKKDDKKGYKEGFHPGDIIHEMCPLEKPKDAKDS